MDNCVCFKAEDPILRNKIYIILPLNLKIRHLLLIFFVIELLRHVKNPLYSNNKTNSKIENKWKFDSLITHPKH